MTGGKGQTRVLYLYPWGNQWDATRANTQDGGPQDTTAVGLREP